MHIQLTWHGDVTPPTIVAATAVIVAVITYAVTRHRDNKIKRAELVQKYADVLLSDDDLFQEFCLIDNGGLRFEKTDERRLANPGWLNAEPERNLIRLLDTFNGVAHNIKRNVLRVRDLRGTTLWYAMRSAFYDQAVRNYIEWVNESDSNKPSGIPGEAFMYFRQLSGKFEKSAAWHARHPIPNGVVATEAPATTAAAA